MNFSACGARKLLGVDVTLKGIRFIYAYCQRPDHHCGPDGPARRHWNAANTLSWPIRSK